MVDYPFWYSFGIQGFLLMRSAHCFRLAMAAVGTGALVACTGSQAQQQTRQGGAQPAVPVTIATVVQKEMPVEIGVIGTAEAYSSVAVRAQITGELTSVNFQQGDDVKDGQTLFTLDQRPLEAALHQAEANLERDTAQSANAKAVAQRSVRVDAHAPNDAGPAATGRITFVDNAVDQTTGTIKIRGTFSNESRRLWPGQFINVVVRLTTDPAALVVPSTAVQTGPQG